jgi:hypothetical protein
LPSEGVSGPRVQAALRSAAALAVDAALPAGCARRPAMKAGTSLVLLTAVGALSPQTDGEPEKQTAAALA